MYFLMQRYEGASNTYGQYTLDAYMMKFTELAEAMANVRNNKYTPLMCVTITW